MNVQMDITERRKHKRSPCNSFIEFIVLSMQVNKLQRIRSSGTSVDASMSGVGIITRFPLVPGQVLEWDDKHQQGELHLAMVKWCHRNEDGYRAGLMLI